MTLSKCHRSIPCRVCGSKLADVDMKVLRHSSKKPLQQRGRDTQNKCSLVVVRSGRVVGKEEIIRSVKILLREFP
jgi:hypothetical protein